MTPPLVQIFHKLNAYERRPSAFSSRMICSVCHCGSVWTGCLLHALNETSRERIL